MPEAQRNGKAFVSGFVAGFTSTVLLHPLDLIKTRFQVDESARSGLRPRGLTALQITRQLGLRGLYRGVVPAVVGASGSWGIYFVVYERLKRAVGEPDGPGRLAPHQYLWTSAAAGAFTTLCTNPIWLVKTRLELQTPGNEPYRGFLHALRTIVREEGPLALYRGLVPALVLVSNGGVQFMVYEELKQRAERPLGALEYMLLGAFSKSIASTLTYPYQLVKSRLQQHNSRYTTTWGTFRDVVRRQGALALFRGLGPNLLRVMPSSAITLASYELISSRLLSAG